MSTAQDHAPVSTATIREAVSDLQLAVVCTTGSPWSAVGTEIHGREYTSEDTCASVASDLPVAVGLNEWDADVIVRLRNSAYDRNVNTVALLTRIDRRRERHATQPYGTCKTCGVSAPCPDLIDADADAVALAGSYGFAP